MPDATFVTHLECSLTGKRYPADQPHNLSQAGKPLLVRYDLEALAGAVPRASLGQREEDLWRYREFLPVRQAANRISLGNNARRSSGSTGGKRTPWSRTSRACPRARSRPAASVSR